MNPGWPLVEAICKTLGIEHTEMITKFDLHHEVDEMPTITIERLFFDYDTNDLVPVVMQFEVVPKGEVPES